MDTVIYVTRNIERALGLALDSHGYSIIANWSPFANEIAAGRDNVLLIQGEKQLDTWELLQHHQTKEFINSPLLGKEGAIRPQSEAGVVDRSSILVFKPTKQVEEICTKEGWTLLNPSADLAAKVEEKITQLEFLKNIRDLFPAYTISKVSEIHWQGETMIIQFNHSHTGSGTVLIKNEGDLNALKEKFPHREARTTGYIDGPLFTNNNVVTPNDVLVGNISYQITGLPPFTDRPFATIGNDWALPKKLLTPKQVEDYNAIARTVGEELRGHGWKGLFGIDVVLEQETGKLYLLEINARQPASTAFEAQLQESKKTRKQESITIFEAHVAALRGEDVADKKLITIDDGAQIIQRITKKELSRLGRDPADGRWRITEVKKELGKRGIHCIPYQNTKPESDLLRIQNPHGIMADHNVFNDIGQEIVSAVSLNI